jgi:hypothetical protein
MDVESEPAAVHPSKKKFIHKEEALQKERTEFKKTGRNKVLKEKQERRKGFPNRPSQSVPPVPPVIPQSGHLSKFDRLNAGQVLHPSWQAKREEKVEMFIQPFEGKRKLL